MSSRVFKEIGIKVLNYYRMQNMFRIWSSILSWWLSGGWVGG